MANIREGAVLWGGKPANLEGPQLAAGQQAPDFLLVGSDMSPLSSKDYAGKVTILAAVPSVDTPVCDLETRTFNQKATEHPGVEVLTVSMDLPFAQKRWCAAAGIER